MSSRLCPEDHPRRSFVSHWLSRNGAIFGKIGDVVAALSFGDMQGEVKQAQKLGLVDASPFNRTGYKGPEAMTWLQAVLAGRLPRHNAARRLPSGEILARLAPSEALVLGSLSGEQEVCLQLSAAYTAELPDGCYEVMRRDANFCFVLLGEDAPRTMARLCGLDLRSDRFADGAVAQTLAADLPVIILRMDVGATPAFRLLGNSASADYFWRCVVDAMTSFDGRVIGLAAIPELRNIP